MPNATESPLSRRDFRRLVERRPLVDLESDPRMVNLARGYWVYDEMLASMKRAGWVRFGPGFKAGVYGHPESDLCIKVMGMGVGENPLYFCERGYYLAHERAMLADFRARGATFAPEVLAPWDSIDLLVEECRASREQAELRVEHHDLLVMERIAGVALATQTGYGLNYDLNIDAFAADVVEEMCAALKSLSVQLMRANANLLLHNDPMPPNILFSLGPRGEIVARLVDFELAQNLATSTPPYVESTVAELYRERHVPVNPLTGAHTTNLDRHLLDGAIAVAERVHEALARPGPDSFLDALSVRIPFFGGISLNLGKARKALRQMVEG